MITDKNQQINPIEDKLSFFFRNDNFSKKRQKAYLKGDKYFTFGVDLKGDPNHFLTGSPYKREEAKRTSTQTGTPNFGNNRKYTRGRRFVYDIRGKVLIK
jgi:hypothetical protein